VVDLMTLLVTIGFLWLFAFTKWFVSRREGAVLVAIFLLYMGWLFYLI
jgi:cation:H+ antiporter